MPSRSDARSRRPRPRTLVAGVVVLSGFAATIAGLWSARTNAERSLRDAERQHAVAQLVEDGISLSATLRSVRLDAAMGIADDRADDVGQAIDALQKAVVAADEVGVPAAALAGYEDVARDAEALSELGSEAGGRFGEWTPAALAPLSSSVSNALSVLVGHPSTGSVAGQTSDRLARALDADTAAAVSGIEVLRTDRDERNPATAAVVDARRRAQALMSAASPTLSSTTRDAVAEVDELEASDQLLRELAALGDPVTAAETDSGADRLHDAAGIRTARLAAAERILTATEVGHTSRSLEGAVRRLDEAGLLLVAVGAAGPMLGVIALLAARAGRRRPRPTPTATSDAVPVVAGGMVDVLAAVVDRHQLLTDVQLRVLGELRVDDGPHRAERRDALLGVADRLALRARRLDEAMLVLAGAGRAERPEQAMALADLMSGAVFEAAAERTIDLDVEHDLRIAGPAALDVAHMVAELVANAAEIGGEPHGGPHGAEERVSVRARRGRDGVLRVVVRDGGAMLDEPTLAALTERVSNSSPEAIAAAMTSGRLGLATVATLAARQGCVVRFGRSTDGATEARLEVPARLVVGESVNGPTTQEEAVQLMDQSPDGGAWGWSADGDYRPAEGWTASGDFVPADAAVPETLAGRLPDGEAFEAGLASLLERDEATR